MKKFTYFEEIAQLLEGRVKSNVLFMVSQCRGLFTSEKSRFPLYNYFNIYTYIAGNPGLCSRVFVNVCSGRVSGLGVDGCTLNHEIGFFRIVNVQISYTEADLLYLNFSNNGNNLNSFCD